MGGNQSQGTSGSLQQVPISSSSNSTTGTNDNNHGAKTTVNTSTSSSVTTIIDKDLLSSNDGQASSGMSAADLDATFNRIAAQTYEDIHAQLSDLQKKHADTSAKLSSTIAQQLATPTTSRSPLLCQEEESSLVSCLTGNKKNPLLCDSLVDKYASCAQVAVLEKIK